MKWASLTAKNKKNYAFTKKKSLVGLTPALSVRSLFANRSQEEVVTLVFWQRAKVQSRQKKAAKK